ncbi:MAG: DNA-methyltransferase Dcm [Candidatus Woesebacteria bacterium GW2011_GWA2_44_33]|uniref:Cytosine-specific methyltransferase n=1 Tax=Candidatus Woesebacteria bacterium GW2011_GWA2_44_33 TaxID=1618564 RepID=A0A0G1M1I4_9BACT|nr:MAG: DNA-methyltransferase Dcm [Candidatus Woesebacteria bacterium GW2011_GWA2_44_33]
MRFIDLFAGIGGFRHGLQKVATESKGSSDSESGASQHGQCAFHCAWSNEWDKYASQIYKKHYGECDTRDIRTVNTKDIPDHDLLCAGFPCQSFSIAGKRLGFEDTRDEGKTFQTILGVLSDLGYEYQWQVLNSKNFGVPQNRERVFIVGHLRETSRPEIFPIGESHTILNQKKYAEQEGRTRVSSTIDARYGSLRNAGETYLHYIGGIRGKRDMWLKDDKQNSRNFSQGQRVYSSDGIASTIAGNAGGLGGKTGLYAIPVLSPDRMEKRQNGRRFKNDGDPAFTLTSQDKHGVYDGLNIRRLTPVECERLQGFPDNWTEGISDTQRYKCLGNAVTTLVITEIGRKLIQTKEVNQI